MKSNLDENIRYTKNIVPERSDILNLYSDAGWHTYTSKPDVLMSGFNKSLAVYAAWTGNELAGLARLVGDGKTIVYIQDILVLRKYRRMGIGYGLLNRITSDFTKVRQIVLLADNNHETHDFYTSAGYTPVDAAGCRAYMMIKGE